MEKVSDRGSLSEEAYLFWRKRLDSIRERVRKLIKSGGQVVAIVEQDVTRVYEGDPEKHSFPKFVHSLERIARNRQGIPVAGAFAYGVHGGNWKDWTRQVEEWSGPLVILPPPTECSADDAIKVLLEDLAGMSFEVSPEPEWVANMSTAREQTLNDRLASVDEEIGRMRQVREELVAHRRARRDFLKLAYEKGIAGLQDVARRAFEELGYLTEEADREVSDEFIVVHGDRRFLIEVKGHRKSAQKEDIRQLDESLDQYERKFQEPIKGVLLVNAWRELPVEERDQVETKNFPDDVEKRAKAIDVCLISGVSLLNALNGFWAGELTADEIFERIFGSTGITSFD
ncbi:MAG TPA: hypothetical protein VMR52_12680 [Dehalococcoidia bacterium]|nr:hypothetical protein [Dehalococcoidia bacterium]